MAFVIRHKKDPRLVYGNPTDGWIETEQKEPENPKDKVAKYETIEQAKEVIRTHGMDAEPVEIHF